MGTIGNLVVVLTADSTRFEQAMNRTRRSVDDTQKILKSFEKQGLDRMSAGMSAAGITTRRVSDQMRELSVYGQRTEQSLTGVTVASHGTREGLKKAENALINLGFGMVGVEGKTGKLAEGLLMMGVGGTVTIAVAAGLAVIGYAYNKLTEHTRKAKEEQDKLTTSLLSSAEARLQREDPTKGFQKKFSDIGASVAAANKALRDALAGSTVTDETGNAFTLVDPKAVAAARAELERLRTAATELGIEYHEALAGTKAAEVQAAIRASIEGFRQQADTVGLSERAIALYKLTAAGASKEQLAMADGLLREVERRKAAIDAAEKHRQALEKVLEQQHKNRAEAAGGGNQTAGAGGTGASGSDVPAFLQGVEATGLRRQKAEALLQAEMRRQQAAAQFVQEVWLNAYRNIQSATASAFEGIFEGQIKSLADFARSVVKIVQQAIAQILAAKATAAFAPALQSFLGAIPGAGVSATGPNGFGGSASLRGGQPVVQYITYAPVVTAFDAQDTARFFRRNRGALIAEVARGSRDSIAVPIALGGGR